MPPDNPTLEEIDEALWWSLHVGPRGRSWWTWVDGLLDDRLAVRSAECSPDRAGPPPGSAHPHEDPRTSSATSRHPSTRLH